MTSSDEHLERVDSADRSHSVLIGPEALQVDVTVSSPLILEHPHGAVHAIQSAVRCGPRRGATSFSISGLIQRIKEVFEEPLHLANIPTGLFRDVRRRVTLLPQLDDDPLDLVITRKQPLVALIRLRKLTGAGIVRRHLNRPRIIGRQGPFPRDVVLQGVLTAILVNDLLFGHLCEKRN